MLRPELPDDDVDNSGKERFVAITGHDDATDGDPGWIVGLIEKRPHVARGVDLMHVGWQCDSGRHQGVLM